MTKEPTRLQACHEHLSHLLAIRKQHVRGLKPLLAKELTWASDPITWAHERMARNGYRTVIALVDEEIERTKTVIQQLSQEKVT